MIVYVIASSAIIARNLAHAGLHFVTPEAAQRELDYIEGIGPDSGPTGLKIIAVELDEIETRDGIVRRVSSVAMDAAAACVWMVCALSFVAFASIVGA
jgi:hypothetical protein